MSGGTTHYTKQECHFIRLFGIRITIAVRMGAVFICLAVEHDGTNMLW
jgi:hypothetical protein